MSINWATQMVRSNPRPWGNLPPDDPNRDPALLAFNKYRLAVDATQQYGLGLEPATAKRLGALLDKITAVELGALSLAGTLPMATFVEMPLPPGSTGTLRQRVKEPLTPVMTAVLGQLTTAQSALAGAGSEATRIVNDAINGAMPDVPDRYTPAEVTDRKQDLQASLEAAGTGTAASMKAQQLLRAALDEDDALTVAVLLGDPMRFVRDRLGVGTPALQRIYVDAQRQQALDKIKAAGGDAGLPLQNPLHQMGLSGVRGMQFILLQQLNDGRTLQDCITLVQDYAGMVDTAFLSCVDRSGAPRGSLYPKNPSQGQ